DCVSVCDDSGQELGRGLVNFSSEEVGAVAGSRRGGRPVGEQLGFPTMEEVLHRENLVLLSSEMDSDEDHHHAANGTPPAQPDLEAGGQEANGEGAVAAVVAAGEQLQQLAVSS
ncbi:Glutamate 5-kinase, partial [Tetrabaena socialis]